VRVCATGLSQSLAEYTAALGSALRAHVEARADALGAPLAADALAQLERMPAPAWTAGWQARRRAIAAELRTARAADVAAEGRALWASVRAMLVLAQGDLLPVEALSLADAFRERAAAPAAGGGLAGGGADAEQWPALGELLYMPRWSPAREGDPCLLPGVQLVADACGRIPR
jgi:hypothetical protein